jgi:hypothetical protein
MPRLIDEAESGGQNLEHALRLLSSSWAGFQINGSSELAALEAALLDRDAGLRAIKRSPLMRPVSRPKGNEPRRRTL